MNTEVLTKSPAETQQFGETLGKQLKGKEILLLEGDLGTGKTLFTKGLASALGIDPSEVVSPSFTLMNRYEGDNDIRLYHLDLYRLGSQGSLSLPEIDDYIDEGIIVIEWAQFLDPTYFQDQNVIHIRFLLSETNDQHRNIKVISSF